VVIDFPSMDSSDAPQKIQKPASVSFFLLQTGQYFSIMVMLPLQNVPSEMKAL
jgi:hypothetical protein